MMNAAPLTDYLGPRWSVAETRVLGEASPRTGSPGVRAPSPRARELRREGEAEEAVPRPAALSVGPPGGGPVSGAGVGGGGVACCGPPPPAPSRRLQTRVFLAENPPSAPTGVFYRNPILGFLLSFFETCHTNPSIYIAGSIFTSEASFRGNAGEHRRGGGKECWRGNQRNLGVRRRSFPSQPFELKTVAEALLPPPPSRRSVNGEPQVCVPPWSRGPRLPLRHLLLPLSCTRLTSLRTTR